MPFINAKRLRDYPRLMFITTWIILAFNLLFHQGWLGGLGQIIGSDFVTFYAAGLAYRFDLPHLYDFTYQGAIQHELIKPTPFFGVDPYINPPYVAVAYSLFTHVSLTYALIIWSVLSMIFTGVSLIVLRSLLPESIKEKIGFWQLLIIVLSFFPFVEGFQMGQNHTLSLLLVSCLVFFTFTDHWFLAGSMAGLMIYKPQLVIGFIVIWIVWRKYKTLLAFIVIAFLWAGLFFLTNGISPFLNYLNTSNNMFLLPYVSGFPGYLQLTTYGLFTTLFPIDSLPIIRAVTLIISAALTIGLAWFAFKLRKMSPQNQIPAIVFALIYPLLATPHSLTHDMVILIPGFIIWARYKNSLSLLYTAIITYLGAFILTLLAAITKIAWVSLLLLGLFIAIIIWLFSHRNEIFRSAGL
jgi:alpha-1,2-mannosyltransferase